MRRLLFCFAILISLSCSSSKSPSGSSALPGHGAISLSVVPNPIIATRVSGDVYDFPFETVIRETGGSEITIQRVSVDVTAFGAVHVYSEKYGPAEIAQRGFPTILPAGGELRYSFKPRKEVADRRLFSAVSADLRIDGIDASGAPASARTSVTVRR